MRCPELLFEKQEDEDIGAVPACVLAATERARADAEQAAADRRAHGRVPREELPWIEGVRVKYGPNVNIVDLSAGGVLIETERPLAPGSRQALEILGPDKPIVVAFGVVRSRIASLDPNGARYRAACVFARPLEHPELEAAVAVRTESGRQAPAAIAATTVDVRPGPIDLLRLNVGTGQLDAPEPTVATPATAVPQSAVPLADPGKASANEQRQDAAGWSKIVARFTDGTMLKGFSQDFVVGRPQFSLWPSIDATAGERVLVPLANLKAVFFVRDFDGQSSYRERKTFCGPTQGRRVQITFADGETLVGTTLGYRAGGTGFFMTPADPRANNARVFVVSGAVRQVRFP